MLISIKRGEQFNYAGTVSKLPSGNWSASAHVRQKNDLIAALTVAMQPPAVVGGDWDISLTAQTAAWPLGSFDCDVRFANADGMVFYSPTFTITVEKEITHA